MATVEFRVFDRSSGTQLTTLPNASDRKWQEVLNEAGNGQVTLGLGEADLAHLVEGNIVRCYLDGTAVFAWEVGPLDQQTVTADAEAGEQRTVNGLGTLAVWREAVVYPERSSASVDFPALGERKPADTRRFDWSSTLFDASGWANAVEVPQPASLAGVLPSGWPGTDAKWIWDALPDGSNNNPTGDVYFRSGFNLASNTTMTLYMTCDDGFEFYLDGQLVHADLRTPFLQLQTRSVTVDLIAGDHVIAVRGVNGPGSGTDNPGAFALAGYEMGADGDPTGSPIIYSGAAWFALGYPAEPPGMTVGTILRILLEEAQDRGALPGVTLGFDDDEDSAGTPWPLAPDVAMKIGANYLEVIAQLCEVYCDVAMAPAALELQAWVERGSASGATFSVTDNLLGLIHRGGDHQTVTAVLGKYGDHWLEHTAGGGRRRESYMELGTASSAAQAERIVEAAMASRVDPVIATTAAFEPVAGIVPHTDFEVGDTVSVPDFALATDTLRVISLTVSETSDDYDFAVELGSLDRSRDERMQLRLRKAGPAGLDWPASPNVVATPDSGLGPERAAVLAPGDSARTNLNDLGDVSAVSDPADGDVFAWDGSLGVGGMATWKAPAAAVTLADLVGGTPAEGDVVTWVSGEAVWAAIPAPPP
jgi:hypothetical protein